MIEAIVALWVLAFTLAIRLVVEERKNVRKGRMRKAERETDATIGRDGAAIEEECMKCPGGWK